MQPRPAKRKRESRPHTFSRNESTELDPSLYIQAHEADIVRGPQAWDAALSLDAENPLSTGRTNGSLMQWRPPMDREHKESADEVAGSELSTVWVERYDARLLLDNLPPAISNDDEDSDISGWSDLPSDAEDTFFLAPSEVDDYRRQKRRRLIEQSREDRLRAICADDPVDQTEVWGGNDEEPDETQKELMRRTAAHVLASPNPAQLEMRILTNHGSDGRFAFLKGRWSRAWRTMKSRVRLDQIAEKAKVVTNQRSDSGLSVGLVGYGDSDDGSSSDSEDNDAPQISNTEVAKPVATPPTLHSSADQTSIDDAIKQARRARAKQWSERRKLQQGADA